MRNETGTQLTQEERMALIASLSNERLLKLQEGTETLYQNLTIGSFCSALSDDQRAERDALLDKVRAFRDALKQEHSTRIFRFCQAQFQTLLADLRPPAPVGRRLIPINAAAQGDQEDQETPAMEQADLRTVGVLVERLHDILNGAQSSGTEER